MQYTLGKTLVAFCLLQILKPEILIWAQDTTTPRGDETNERTVANNEEELVTTTLLLDSSIEGLTEQPAKNCECNCSDASLQELCDRVSTSIESNITIEENTTSIPANNEETTTNAPIVNDETPTTSPTNKDETTIPENFDIGDPVTAQPFNCTGAGIMPHATDCRRFYNCSQADSLDSFQATEQLCPTGLAFNIEFSSCMRDLSPCSSEHGGFECSRSGNFPDPNNDTNLYYRCVPYLDGRAALYHKYIVKCGTGRIFIPQVEKCLIDLNAVGSSPGFYLNPTEPSDEQLVKAELKQWKVKEKMKLKAEKNKLKYEQKLQKELAKKQAKEAKEKAKAEKNLQKQQEIEDSI